MAVHPIDESELQLRLLPYRSRWLPEDTNLGWQRIHEAGDALYNLITALDLNARALEQDKNWSPVGVRSKRAEYGAKAWAELKDHKPVKTALQVAERSIETIKNHMKDLPTAPADEALASEIRAYVRGLKSPIDFAMSHLGDSLVLGAIISAPSFLSGLSDVEQAAVRAKAINALYPEQQKHIERLQGAMDELTAGLTAARKLVLERADIEVDDRTGEVKPAHAMPPAPATIVGRSSSALAS